MFVGLFVVVLVPCNIVNIPHLRPALRWIRSLQPALLASLAALTGFVAVIHTFVLQRDLRRFAYYDLVVDYRSRGLQRFILLPVSIMALVVVSMVVQPVDWSLPSLGWSIQVENLLPYTAGMFILFLVLLVFWVREVLSSDIPFEQLEDLAAEVTVADLTRRPSEWE